MSRTPPDISWAMRASFLACPMVTGFAQVGLLPVLPQINAHFGGTSDAGMLVRFLVTGVGLAMILGAPFAGLLAKRIGWRRSMIGAVVTFSLAGAAGAVVGNLWAIVATRLLVGLSVAVLGALIMAILTLKLEGTARDRWIGYVVVSGTIGAVFLIPLSGFVGGIDWRLPFVLHLAGLLVLFLIVPGIREPEASTVTGDMQAAPAASGFPIWAIGLGLLVGILVQAQSTFVPFHMADIGITSPRTIGLAIVAALPLIAVISFLYGNFRRFVSMKAVFVIASGFCAAGFLTIGLSQTLPGVLIGTLLLGIGGGLLSPNMFAFAAARSAPMDRARDIGMVRGAFSAGPFVGQIALEPIAATAGAGIAVAALCVVAVCAMAAFWGLLKGGLRAAPA